MGNTNGLEPTRCLILVSISEVLNRQIKKKMGESHRQVEHQVRRLPTVPVFTWRYGDPYPCTRPEASAQAEVIDLCTQSLGANVASPIQVIEDTPPRPNISRRMISKFEPRRMGPSVSSDNKKPPTTARKAAAHVSLLRAKNDSSASTRRKKERRQLKLSKGANRRRRNARLRWNRAASKKGSRAYVLKTVRYG